MTLLDKRTALLVLLLGVVALLTAAPTAQAPSALPMYEGVEPDAMLLAIDKQALKDAYHDQLVHLFSIWIKGQAKSSTEIKAGIKLARSAYETAAREVAKREQEISK
jgi:uncharacterized caspase-like protein